MVEKKAKLMSAKEERAHNKKNVTKVDPDDDDTNVHRLVQDENAKTILLNFPLEVSFNEKDVSTATSTASKCKPSPKLGIYSWGGSWPKPKKVGAILKMC